jgi:phosphoribosylformylglycinamidine synthase
VRVLIRYDVENLSDQVFDEALGCVFCEPPVDDHYLEMFEMGEGDFSFGVEYLPGQFDQRADSAVQCIRFLDENEEPIVRTATVYVISGLSTQDELEKVKSYCINPVDSRETSEGKPETLVTDYQEPDDISVYTGFRELSIEDTKALYESLGLAMTFRDFLHIQGYFQEEGRDPSATEIRVLDTYWSDHCRHTTFSTVITDVEFDEGYYRTPIETAYQSYLDTREMLYQDRDDKPICLMDLALVAMKKLKAEEKLFDLEESEEINACSVVVPVEIEAQDGTKSIEEWLVFFKNETHNHPTEIEPFGGAATCLGGAIRDPLSGRGYVYQAMRVTGAADPTVPVAQTLKGKLPQKKLVRWAAAGYSSYGNQIGLATGLVKEIYHPGYAAKRMEIGAVMGAAPRKNVIRETSDPGDVIILLGGRTGRDGCGGATGSSKVHTVTSIETCGAEVQKGTAPTERKIQRLFRRSEVSRLIKKCNDFGAGGVSVAIGELADGLIVDLDKVPKKYAGLDGTELAISESQERLAVVVDPKDAAAFLDYAGEENLEAVVVAEVTEDPRLVLTWRGEKIVDLKRSFLDTNGARQETKVKVDIPDQADNYFTRISSDQVKNKLEEGKGKEAWIALCQDLNVCSQKGLVEMFDSSIGAASVLMPYGGAYQMTETQVMAAKLPVLTGQADTVTLMSHGFDPYLSSWSPYHGAVYAVLESMSKIVAAGGDYRKIHFTFQEYFRRMTEDPKRWSQPFAALLGAYDAQLGFGLASIGGKDSMSGTFQDMDVPPTLVSFAVDTAQVGEVITPELKRIGSSLVRFKIKKDEFDIPKYEYVKKLYGAVWEMIQDKVIISAYAADAKGLAAAISKMALGNRLGVTFADTLTVEDYFENALGDIVAEIPAEKLELLDEWEIPCVVLGTVIPEEEFRLPGQLTISLEEIEEAWTKTLEKVFPTKSGRQTRSDGTVVQKAEQTEIGTVVQQAEQTGSVGTIIQQTEQYVTNDVSTLRTEYTDGSEEVSSPLYRASDIYICKHKVAVPRVLITVFPGTNCEYDTARAFERAGAQVDTLVFRNRTAQDIRDSVSELERGIAQAQILMFPGGFSAGDEPDGSAKFFATAYRNAKLKEAVEKLLSERDGLALGICNGFQALIKLGLVPYGEITGQQPDSPTLTFNTINRHISKMAYTKVVSNKSPWLAQTKPGEVYVTPVSHGEGRFVASKEWLDRLFTNGQVATRYADMHGNVTMDETYNVNGSYCAIEGITSPDGRIFGKMAHIERRDSYVAVNITGEQDMHVFEAGVAYFK